MVELQPRDLEFGLNLISQTHKFENLEQITAAKAVIDLGESFVVDGKRPPYVIQIADITPSVIMSGPKGIMGETGWRKQIRGYTAEPIQEITVPYSPILRVVWEEYTLDKRPGEQYTHRYEFQPLGDSVVVRKYAGGKSYWKGGTGGVLIGLSRWNWHPSGENPRYPNGVFTGFELTQNSVNGNWGMRDGLSCTGLFPGFGAIEESIVSHINYKNDPLTETIVFPQ